MVRLFRNHGFVLEPGNLTMIRWLKRLILTVAAVAMGTAAVFAQDTGAITSGNWEDSSIWTSGTVPGSSNNVYIGSSYPTGSATTATVTLTASESAANVYLGDNSSFVPPFATGTLNLGNNSLGRITTAGSVTNYTDPTIVGPAFMTAGPDGAMWFTI